MTYRVPSPDESSSFDRSLRTEDARDHIPSTPWATRYSSSLTNQGAAILSADDMKLFSHVSCGYLSSGGDAPTLYALKRHAQSLTILISKLSKKKNFVLVSQDNDGKIDDAIMKLLHGGAEDPEGHLNFVENNAFDWLVDLSRPYQTRDELHHVPLWALANNVMDESEEHGIRYHCPLHKVQVKRCIFDEPSKDPNPPPFTRAVYQTHINLLRHANECLEILDSDYSATGGLLSNLPQEPQRECQNESQSESQADMHFEGARNTLVGQWILHHQHLVARLHELGIAYNNALSLIKGESHIPMELLSTAGTFKRRNGEVPAYPQDKFVLAGVSEDKLDRKIHVMLSRKEQGQIFEDSAWRAKGVMSDDTLNHAEGLVWVDVTSRFFRLKGKDWVPNEEQPIIMIPAIELKRQYSEEQKPTVVAIREGDEAPWGGVRIGAPAASQRVQVLEEQNKKLEEEVKMLKTFVEYYERSARAELSRVPDPRPREAGTWEGWGSSDPGDNSRA